MYHVSFGMYQRYIMFHVSIKPEKRAICYMLIAKSLLHVTCYMVNATCRNLLCKLWLPLGHKNNKGGISLMTPPRLASGLQSLPPILHMLHLCPMSSCSKAPRGLFVLLRTDGIFTVNALSPSSSLRQCPHHYSIRAGQNFIV